MTTLLSWTGVDTHGPASIYIASDSRISWGISNTWDVGRKVFSSKNRPEIFGYCGSVFFPIQILGQLTELIDSEMFFLDEEPFSEKLEKIRLAVEHSYNNLPKSQKGSCRILYASRVGLKMRSSFHVAEITISATAVTSTEIALPEQSGIIVSAGSGKAALRKWHEEWVGLADKDPHQSGRTSRNVFSAFCDSLTAKDDPFSGGAPQLVGLYRNGPANNFGIIHNSKRFLNGLEVGDINLMNNIEWRNDLFERCCGDSMQIMNKAQRQPKLKGVKQP
ncbi:hypothetical protein [Vibrio splendidus]|uniref:hypothetical protein n=1 Tax=Vibrio splendidus TaxID=29497 RepID=UPI000D36803A|nr:hypothetical protein [Vibrio splendidus]PTP28057.1 hypothetical protein CWN95_23175 [Vibrio splendidus]